MPAPKFTLRQARSVQVMLDEVNSPPPSRIAIGGVPRLAHELASAIAGDARNAVEVITRPASPDELGGVIAFIVVIDKWPLDADILEQLRAADRAAISPVAVLIGLEAEPRSDEIPYVLSTDVVRADDPLGAVQPAIERVAAQAKGDAYLIARALPQYQEEVSKAIINHYARLNGLVSLAALVPVADLPVLTINQLRMVTRLAGAHGIALDARRLIELTLIVGAGLGLRAVVRSALSALPGPRRVIRGGVALGGTVAIGEAALRRIRAEVETGTRAADTPADAL